MGTKIDKLLKNLNTLETEPWIYEVLICSNSDIYKSIW